jgi:hypothetical protein
MRHLGCTWHERLIHWTGARTLPVIQSAHQQDACILSGGHGGFLSLQGPNAHHSFKIHGHCGQKGAGLRAPSSGTGLPVLYRRRLPAPSIVPTVRNLLLWTPAKPELSQSCYPWPYCRFRNENIEHLPSHVMYEVSYIPGS